MADEAERRTERIPLLMTPSEVKALDDWAFANRIRGRGEAIRRLIEAGLGKPKATPSGGTGSGSAKKPAGSSAARPRTRKDSQERKAAPATPTSKEAQLRALREQGAR
jgi:hypothetical protein